MTRTIELHAFSGLTGAHVRRLAATEASWSDSVNEVGSMDAKVVDDGRPGMRDAIRPYGSIIAALDGSAVLHAGYVTAYRYDRAARTYSVTAGGGATVLAKRLVLNKNLRARWADGTVLVDEDNPPGDWTLTATGSYSDLISALVSETETWGALPITPAAPTGGDKTRTWDCWDLATVLDRIQDIGDLENGPEWRFDPVLSDDWTISFAQVTSADGGEIVDHSWRWNALLPGAGVTLGDEDVDGGLMASACYATGGRDEDNLLVAHAADSTLTGMGWPLLQTANRSHTSVSVLKTLQSYARADVAAGDRGQLTTELRVPSTLRVHVGDHARVRYGTADSDVVELKVTDVKGSMGSSQLTLGCREVG